MYCVGLITLNGEIKMNEQFRTLARKAMVERASGFREFDANLFAELIVKECCRMMVDLEKQYPANLTVWEIKKHFGINNDQ